MRMAVTISKPYPPVGIKLTWTVAGCLVVLPASEDLTELPSAFEPQAQETDRLAIDDPQATINPPL